MSFHMVVSLKKVFDPMGNQTRSQLNNRAECPGASQAADGTSDRKMHYIVSHYERSTFFLLLNRHRYLCRRQIAVCEQMDS